MRGSVALVDVQIWVTDTDVRKPEAVLNDQFHLTCSHAGQPWGGAGYGVIARGAIGIWGEPHLPPADDLLHNQHAPGSLETVAVTGMTEQRAVGSSHPSTAGNGSRSPVARVRVWARRCELLRGRGRAGGSSASKGSLGSQIPAFPVGTETPSSHWGC